MNIERCTVEITWKNSEPLVGEWFLFLCTPLGQALTVSKGAQS